MNSQNTFFIPVPTSNIHSKELFKQINRSGSHARLLRIGICLVLLSPFQSLAAQVSFSAKTDYVTGSGPFSVSVGDLNGDGKPDMVVANNNDNTVSVFLNTTEPGSSTSSYTLKSDFTTGSSPRSVSIGDLNGDGKPDLAVANIGNQTVSVLFNTTGPGSFTSSYSVKTDFAAGNSPSSVSVGDFNGDGIPDLAVANSGENTVSILINTAAAGAAEPSFSAKTDFATGNNPTSVSIADLNQDGKIDLVAANSNDSTISILINATNAGASSPSFFDKVDFTTGNGPFSVSSSDLNGDGKPDLVVANNNNYTVSILFNSTEAGASIPSFSVKTDFTIGLSPRSVSIGDLNIDGKPDVAVANIGDQSVSILLNTTNTGDPTPSFSRKTGYAIGNAQRCVSIDDLNGDEKADLVVVNFFENTVSVLLNDTTMLFPAVALSQPLLEFGSVTTGAFKDTTVTIANNGTDTLKISDISVTGGVFTTLNTSITIPPSGSFIHTVRFSPLMVTTYNGLFLIASNASSSPDTVKISGRGISNQTVDVTDPGNIQRIFALNQNYPNPFNPATKIKYQLPSSGHVVLKVYDVLGKEVATIVDEVQNAGEYTAVFDGLKLSSGLYFYRLHIGAVTETKKMMLAK